MPELPDKIKLAELLTMARQDKIDVPEIQRIFNRKPTWVAELLDSLAVGICIGMVLVWAPERRARPTAGRYRDSSSATWWILDGQQRVTGLLGALGIRPTWIPDEMWDRMNGPALQVAVGFDRSGRAVFRPLRPDIGAQVPLGDLLRAKSVTKLLKSAGVGEVSPEQVEQFTALRDQMMSAEIPIKQLPGDWRLAALGFERHNKKGSNTGLEAEELSLCLMGMVFPSLQRQHVDPLLAEAVDRGFGQTVTRRRVSKVLENLLPVKIKSRAASTDELAAEDVEQAATRGTRAFHEVMDYLNRRGITHEELLPTRSVVVTLAHLFDQFPQALRDDFPKRWMVHWIGRHTFLTRKRSTSTDAYAVRSAGSYDQAKAALTTGLPEGSAAQFVPERLHVRSTNTSFGAEGFLYAVACADQLEGAVTDLAHPKVRFPNARLRLRPLCLRPGKNVLVHHAFLTEHSAEVIRAHGGWTVEAYEELRCGDDALTAQMLPKPDPSIAPDQIGAWLIETRAPLVAAFLDRFLIKTGPLHGIDE